MKTRLPKGVSFKVDRHGVRRWRFRKKGQEFQLGRSFGSPEFWERLEAAEEAAKCNSTKHSRKAPDSLEAVILSFRSSPRAMAWSPSTAYMFGRILNELSRDHGHRRITTMTTAAVEGLMREKTGRPTAANARRKMLSRLCRHAMKLGIISQDVAALADSVPIKSEGIKAWTEEEARSFANTHPPGTFAHRVFTLAAETGAARSDLVALGWHNVRGGRFTYRREKMRGRGGIEVSFPVSRELAELLASIPKTQLLFLETQAGRPRSADGLGNLMRRWCREAGLEGLSAHGLRKLTAKRLAEAGATAHEIGSITGHRTLAEVQRYTAEADRRGLAASAIHKLDTKRT